MNKPKKKAESNIDFKAQQLDENSEIYINLLCDRYKHRGITTKVKSDAAAQSRKNEAASKAAQISVNTGDKSQMADTRSAEVEGDRTS